MNDGRKVVYAVLAVGTLAGIAYALMKKEEEEVIEGGVGITSIQVKVV